MNKNRSVSQYTVISAIVLVISLLLSKVFTPESNKSILASKNDSFRTVIIDPGHGGKDGGAVSITGALEKDLNLNISTVLNDILYILGYDTIMTRDSDVELTHSSGGTRKMQDLKGRLEFTLNYPSCPLISIHMNKFPISKYNGAQIYYTVNNEYASSLASIIRQNIIDNVQPDNHRSIKPSSSSIYLLHKATNPAILIECGFISNPDEAMLLDDGIYKTKLASVIASGINLWYNDYISNEG